MKVKINQLPTALPQPISARVTNQVHIRHLLLAVIEGTRGKPGNRWLPGLRVHGILSGPKSRDLNRPAIYSNQVQNVF